MSRDLERTIDQMQFRRRSYAPSECRGIVYIVHFGGVYKIGFTTTSIRQRIKQFSKIRLPFRFEPVFECPCLNPNLTEQWVHREVNQYRLDGEWFQLDEVTLCLAKFFILSMADCVEIRPGCIEPVMTGLQKAPRDSRAGYIEELVAGLTRAANRDGHLCLEEGK